MSWFKELFATIERNKNRMTKIFIFCSALKFIFSLLYRICSIKDSRTQFESTTNIYCLILIGLVFIHELLPCIVLKMITENMRMITHHRGKGILFILVSLIYMSSTLDDQQNYSAYLLFVVGVILVVTDCGEVSSGSKFKELDYDTAKMSVNKTSDITPMESTPISDQNKHVNLGVNNDIVLDTKKPVNPYDIPDDF